MTGWGDGVLRSPVSGRVLTADTAHSLSDGAERWPVVEGIPYLRTGRAALVERALAALDAGRGEDVLVALLADQDDWARSAPAGEDRLRALVQAPGTSFREAMDRLAFGPVGTYFAHRWSDPTFVSGLALAEAHGVGGAVFELACGAGHFLREFERVARPAGGDVVFAKLWLARRYVAPEVPLVCFDAASPWPFADGVWDWVFCHDAFYFLPEKPFVAGEMRRTGRGRAAVGHAHNALVDNLSSGSPLAPEGYAGLFEGMALYDDRELTRAAVERRAPVAERAEALAGAPAVSMATGVARALGEGLTMPRAGAGLRRNPLYVAGRVEWPSERYATEYGGLATYPGEASGPDAAVAGESEAVDALARCRVLLDLPGEW